MYWPAGNLLWDILRLPSSHRAVLGLYVILHTMTSTGGGGGGGGRAATIHIAAYKSSPRYTATQLVKQTSVFLFYLSINNMSCPV